MKFIDLIVIGLIIGCIYLAVKVLKSGKAAAGAVKAAMETVNNVINTPSNSVCF